MKARKDHPIKQTQIAKMPRREYNSIKQIHIVEIREKLKELTPEQLIKIDLSFLRIRDLSKLKKEIEAIQ